MPDIFLIDVIAPLIMEPRKVMLFMLLAIALEAGVLALYRYRRIKGAFIDSLLINIVSFLAGIALQQLGLVDNIEHVSRPKELLALLALTIIIEGMALWLRNRKTSLIKMLSAIIVANFCSYGLFVLMFDPFSQ